MLLVLHIHTRTQMSARGGGEILTLQLGHYANHVGAHLWNAQEALFHYDPTAPVCTAVVFLEVDSHESKFDCCRNLRSRTTVSSALARPSTAPRHTRPG